MKIKTFGLLSLIVIASLALAACGGGSATQAPSVDGGEGPTSGGSNVTTIVVTSTPMSDIGSLLGDQPMTPQVSGNIEWDELKKMPEWTQKPGLTGADALYVQSSKPSEIDLPLLPNQKTFTVPAGTTLVFGAYNATVVLENGKSYSFKEGFYGAFTEGTEIKSLHIVDGFALLIGRDSGQDEYCLRVAQAINQKWAHSHLYRPSAWTNPVCEGVVATVIDPND